MMKIKLELSTIIGLSYGLLVVISLLLVYPGVGAKMPVWMGAIDGFMLAKARFFSQGLGLGSWNGQWFLGIPGQHVGSPLVGWILSLVTGSDPVSSFGVWRSMVVLGVVGSVLGVLVFAKDLLVYRSKIPDKRKKGVSAKKYKLDSNELFIALFAALFVLLVPSILFLFPQIWRVMGGFGWPSWMVFSPFYLGDGHKTLGFVAVLPALVVAWRNVFDWKLSRAVLLSFLVGLILLVDSLSFLTFVLWLVVLVFSVVVQPKLRSTSVVVLVARMAVIVILGSLLVSFWFTPGFFLTFLSSPSLGGRPFSVVAVGLVNRVFTFLPAILGIFAARKWLKRSNVMLVMGLMGMLIFGSLTMEAFIADHDFWQDYSRFGRSLDLSLALLVGGYLWTKKLSRKLWIGVLVAVLLVSLPFMFKRDELLQGGTVFEKTSEYRVGKELDRLVKEACFSRFSTSEVSVCPLRAYLSGSSTFWLNSWFGVAQVRGGGEQGSINDWWPHASYQIREGIDPELSALWLEALGVSYLLVHGPESSEVYHDFAYPQKFERMEGWQKAWEDRGDTIYRRNDTGTVIARVVDLDLLRIVPEKGDDLKALRRYVGYLKGEANFEWKGKREIEIAADVSGGEGVRLAVSFSPFWKVQKSSMPVEVEKDGLGMMVLKPKQAGKLEARIMFAAWPDTFAGLVLSLLGLYVLVRRPVVIERLAKRLRSIVGRDTELDRSAW